MKMTEKMYNPTYLPIVGTVMLMGVIWTTYGMCVSEGHCPAFWPTISLTGANRPESCVFGLGLNLAAGMLLLMTIFRHSYVDGIADRMGLDLKSINVASTVFKLCLIIGMVLVACFQCEPDRSLEWWVHNIASYILWPAGVIYMTLDFVVTSKIFPLGSTMVEYNVRLGFVIYLWVVGAMTLYASLILHQSGDKGNFFDICEWLCWFGLSGSFLTYAWDFSRMQVGLKSKVNL